MCSWMRTACWMPAHGIHHDLVFLDILMPLLNGMDAARELRRVDAAARIVFLTSSPEFALESYAVKAQGYILKPVTGEKLREALEENGVEPAGFHHLTV